MKTSNPRVIAALKRLKDRDGFLRPERVVEAARSTRSVLHKYFIWDNDEAARQYRLTQASELIRTVVHYVKVGGDRRPVRAFVSLSPDRNKGLGYREMVVCLSNPNFRDQMLRDAIEELDFFERKYQNLKELTQVFAASRAARKSIMESWGENNK